MVDRVAVGVFRKSGITELVIDRDAVAIVIEVIEQLFAAQIVGDHGQAILVLIGTVIGTQGSASDSHALDAEGFTGRVIFVGHL